MFRIGRASGAAVMYLIKKLTGELVCERLGAFGAKAVADGTDDGGHRRNAEVDTPRDRVGRPTPCT